MLSLKGSLIYFWLSKCYYYKHHIEKYILNALRTETITDINLGMVSL